MNKKLLDKNIMVIDVGNTNTVFALVNNCLLYTSDAADE